MRSWKPPRSSRAATIRSTAAWSSAGRPRRTADGAVFTSTRAGSEGIAADGGAGVDTAGADEGRDSAGVDDGGAHAVRGGDCS